MPTNRWCGVYALRCDANGKMYIGSSTNMDRRIHEHMAALRFGRHPNPDMQADFNKYGERFSACILQDYMSGDTSRTHLESAYMTIFGTRDRNRGYNYMDITNDHTLKKMKFYPMTPETKDTIPTREWHPRKRSDDGKSKVC